MYYSKKKVELKWSYRDSSCTLAFFVSEHFEIKIDASQKNLAITEWIENKVLWGIMHRVADDKAGRTNGLPKSKHKAYFGALRFELSCWMTWASFFLWKSIFNLKAQKNNFPTLRRLSGMDRRTNRIPNLRRRLLSGNQIQQARKHDLWSSLIISKFNLQVHRTEL